MRLTISEPQAFIVLIPKGTRVMDARETLVWETMADVYVTDGNEYANTQLQKSSARRRENGEIGMWKDK